MTVPKPKNDAPWATIILALTVLIAAVSGGIVVAVGPDGALTFDRLSSVFISNSTPCPGAANPDPTAFVTGPATAL